VPSLQNGPISSLQIQSYSSASRLSPLESEMQRANYGFDELMTQDTSVFEFIQSSGYQTVFSTGCPSNGAKNPLGLNSHIER